MPRYFFLRRTRNETDHAVLVAQSDYRHIPGHVVLDLDDLLRGLCDVGCIGKRQVVLDLLLDGHGRTGLRGRSLGRQPLRIDLDAANAKEFLYAVAHGGIERRAEDRAGGLRIEAQTATGSIAPIPATSAQTPEVQ